MQLSDFDYQLKKELIALQPLEKRDNARMLVHHNNEFLDDIVLNLDKYLNKNDLIVFNDTKVIAAKLDVLKNHSRIKIYFNEQIDASHWYAFAKPAKKLSVGDMFKIADDFSLEVIEKECSEYRIKNKVNANDDLFELLEKYGDAPLPPYIEKFHNATAQDKKSYQSVFAKNWGSVAAPTASLHFTDSLLKKISDKGVKSCFVTLHVGSGTFLPISEENIDNHKMHSEYCTISKEVADLVNHTKSNGGKVLAVGSTALRTLESAADDSGAIKTFSGKTDIFIKPGYNFKVVDMLLTNFHLPKSTLLVLVAAFIGYNNMKELYRHAIEKEYRFFSYGDSCLLNRC
ncbi:MAG: tRNA preQ1(34) S-adenosylmethionine ribosyltransferase-isomerase QueA [Rickettsiales bacterium]|nr:tRNA preQ1(34) S-adenosylmethionine ribosyltransferase-isomerase QueA [Rickettsiales bacterium]